MNEKRTTDRITPGTDGPAQEVCDVCFRHCHLTEGQRGFCHGRMLRDGKVVAANYGQITSMAFDPIEKKPLRRFHPGTKILSIGSYGCNLSCLFCQNHDISLANQRAEATVPVRDLTPEEVAQYAIFHRDPGNIGVAYTYNEPLIGWEFVRDTARLIHKAGMKNVLVTNGTASLWVLEELLPYVDAMNIDIKAFSEDFYKRIAGGNLQMVKDFVERAVRDCHVEITTLIVPGLNDSAEEIRALTSWIASLPHGSEIPYHVSRFFPRHQMTDRGPTPVEDVYRLAEVAREHLRYVYTGNC